MLNAPAHPSLAPPLPDLPEIPKAANPRTIPELLSFVEQAYSTESPYRLSQPDLVFHPQLTATIVKPVLDHIFPLTSASSSNVGTRQASTTSVTESDEPGSSSSAAAGPSALSSSSSPPQDPNDPSQDVVPGSIPLPTATLNPNATSSTEQALSDDLAYFKDMLRSSEPAGAGPSDSDRPLWRKEKGLAVLYLLDARLHSRPLSEASHPIGLLQLAQKIFQETESVDLVLAAERLGSFARNVILLAQAYGQTPLAIEIIQTLIARSSRPGQLTPMHGCLLESLYQLGDLDAARYWLSGEIDSFSWPGLSYRDVLSYFYLCGIFAIAGQQWTEANDNLEIVVTVPATTCSSIQLAAHRKLLFVSLIVSGQPPKYPRYQSTAVQRAIRSSCKEYIELGSAFEAMNEEKVVKVAQDSTKVFEQHGDLELMQRALSTYGERNLLQLPAMYARMSIQDVAAHASSLVAGEVTVEACEQMIETLVSRGSLHAIIDRESAPRSVRFVDASETFNSAQSAAQVTALVRKADMLERYTKGYDDQMGMDAKWLRKAIDKGDNERTAAPPISDGPSAAGGVRGVGSNWNDTGF